MGANMQRQAVPLLVTQQPIVGAGMEYKAACDSGVCVWPRTTVLWSMWMRTRSVIRTSKTTADEYRAHQVHALPTRAPA